MEAALGLMPSRLKVPADEMILALDDRVLGGDLSKGKKVACVSNPEEVRLLWKDSKIVACRRESLSSINSSTHAHKAYNVMG